MTEKPKKLTKQKGHFLKTISFTVPVCYNLVCEIPFGNLLTYYAGNATFQVVETPHMLIIRAAMDYCL